MVLMLILPISHLILDFLHYICLVLLRILIFLVVAGVHNFIHLRIKELVGGKKNNIIIWSVL